MLSGHEEDEMGMLLDQNRGSFLQGIQNQRDELVRKRLDEIDKWKTEGGWANQRNTDTNLAHERMQKGVNETSIFTNAANNDALAGVRGAQAINYGAHTGNLNANTDESKFKLGMLSDVRPEALANMKITYGMNTTLNTGEMDTRLESNYKARNARMLAMPQWDQPYQKASPNATEGFGSNMWRSIINKPFPDDAVMKDRMKTDAANEDYYNQNPMARPKKWWN